MSDLRDIPKELKRRITFLPVRNMREVLDHALVDPLDWKPGTGRAAIPYAPSGPAAPAHASKRD
jgi:hypothetical protein